MNPFFSIKLISCIALPPYCHIGCDHPGAGQERPEIVCPGHMASSRPQDSQQHQWLMAAVARSMSCSRGAGTFSVHSKGCLRWLWASPMQTAALGQLQATCACGRPTWWPAGTASRLDGLDAPRKSETERIYYLKTTFVMLTTQLLNGIYAYPIVPQSSHVLKF